MHWAQANRRLLFLLHLPPRVASRPQCASKTSSGDYSGSESAPWSFLLHITAALRLGRLLAITLIVNFTKNDSTMYSEVKNYFTLLGVRPWNYWHYKFVSKLSILVPMHGRRGTKRVRGSVLGWCGKNFTIPHMSLMISCSTGDTGGEAGGESEEDDNKGEQTREIPMCTSVSLTCQCCIQFLQFRDGLRPPSSGA